MKAVIVTPFDNYSYNVRIKYVEKYLMSYGYDVTILSSDFDHRNKCKYITKRNNLELLHVPEYKKNLSFERIYSHYIFSKKVKKRIEELEPDLIYGSVPPNFLVRSLAKYKKYKPEVRLIFEIGDLWPETLPLNGKIKIFAAPLTVIWARIRDNYLKYSDGIIFECNLFKNILKNRVNRVPCETIYLCKENSYPDSFEYDIESNEIGLAYVGSINHIIDIDIIIRILLLIKEKRRVKFHIIGAGENTSKLLQACKDNNILHQYYGTVYDENEKGAILRQCQFALNIMVPSIVVGATMKSLEYFHWGMIVINNIPGDSQEIINKYNCGFNINKDNIYSIIDYICQMSSDEKRRMMSLSRKAYLELFDEALIKKQFKFFYERLFSEK